MTKSKVEAQSFAQLHSKENPLILFNIWDAGSAKAAEQSGVKAIATSSWAIAAAHGVDDGEKLPFEVVLITAKEIIASVDLPVSIDFESGYGTSPSEIGNNITQLIDCGAIGINFEDYCHREKIILPISAQVERLKLLRGIADKRGAELLINARTDIFLSTDPITHDKKMLEHALKRALAYKEAGSDCFFAPGLVNKELIAELCTCSPLPVNIMAMPKGPSLNELVELGVMRISYGSMLYSIANSHLQSHVSEILRGIQNMSC